jgi:hypothetical protein
MPSATWLKVFATGDSMSAAFRFFLGSFHYRHHVTFILDHKYDDEVLREGHALLSDAAHWIAGLVTDSKEQALGTFENLDHVSKLLLDRCSTFMAGWHTRPGNSPPANKERATDYQHGKDARSVQDRVAQNEYHAFRVSLEHADAALAGRPVHHRGLLLSTSETAAQNESRDLQAALLVGRLARIELGGSKVVRFQSGKAKLGCPHWYVCRRL